MATFEKDGAGGSGDEVSPEFLRKLDSLKKKDNGARTGRDSGDLGRADEEQPPAELLRKLEALKKGAGQAPEKPSSPDESGASPEFLRKLDALKKGGGVKTGDVGPTQQDAASEVSPELLRKLNQIAAKKSGRASDDLKPTPAAAGQAAAPQAAAPTSGASPPFAGEGAIEKAIELMRQLPINDSNVDLMMQVVKSTLESFNINIDEIIADAAKRRRELEGKIQALQQEVASFEEEIRKRTGAIHGLRRQYEEITLVGDRLLSGQKRARQANPEIGSHLTDSELWGADDEETSAALDALLPGANRE
ncbi:MAG: hypothetical protein IPK13_08415 [Deltaproteobacteria bacterium]|nr:hypothetical protein [Deltaproteobacteria bacterium]